MPSTNNNLNLYDSIQMVLMEETQDQKTDLYLYI